MTRGELREDLLAEHARLRQGIVAVRLALEKARRGEGSPSRIRAVLAGLADALRAHNLHEERALGDVLPSVDPWGHERAAILEEAHIREHRETFDALVRSSQLMDLGALGDEIGALSARLLAHMAWEEKSFLNDTVLRDDDIAIDGESG